MANINVEYLQPGMVLNGDVKDLNGCLLLTAGTKLTEKHLYILRSWGIAEADIQSVTREEVEATVHEEVDPVKLIDAQNELRTIFSHTERDHPVIRELFRVCALRKARGGSRKNGNSV